MPRVIVLDTFPLSSTGKREPAQRVDLTVSEKCNLWIRDCIRAGNKVVAPSIAYYEVIRELRRLKATQQISRVKAFCVADPGRLISISDSHLEQAASLWAECRNAGNPTAAPEALDCDVILAAQALSLGLPTSDYVVATTNVGHLSRFVPADLWANIEP